MAEEPGNELAILELDAAEIAEHSLFVSLLHGKIVVGTTSCHVFFPMALSARLSADVFGCYCRLRAASGGRRRTVHWPRQRDSQQRADQGQGEQAYGYSPHHLVSTVTLWTFPVNRLSRSL